MERTSQRRFSTTHALAAVLIASVAACSPASDGPGRDGGDDRDGAGDAIDGGGAPDSGAGDPCAGGLARVPGDPSATAAAVVPGCAYEPVDADYAIDESDVPGRMSKRYMSLLLKPEATLGELNALLVQEGATVVGSRPGDANFASAWLLLRFPTTTARELIARAQRLASEGIADAVAPDVLLLPDAVTDDDYSPYLWEWESRPAGGNWGLEQARVPQLWNWNAAVEERRRPATRIIVIDAGFEDHVDLPFAFRVHDGRMTDQPDRVHGNHVSGIIAASHSTRQSVVHPADGTRAQTGIDGVNPFTDLIGLTVHSTHTFVADTLDAFTSVADIEIVNMSIGFNWTLRANRDRMPLTETALERATFTAEAMGTTFAGVAAAHPSVLFVASAGNDRGWIPASINSPQCYAGLVAGSSNIIVVGSHLYETLSAFSNPGHHVLAPGEDVLSAIDGNGYGNLSGTSMAAPFVAGLAGYLRAWDHDLPPEDLIELILSGEDGKVDAFTSMLALDTRYGDGRDVLRALLDIDDGSADGSERVAVPAADSSRNRSFETVVGGDKEETEGEGDGVIDMADFRRYRDWLLFHEASGDALNGTDEHLKHDANRDGVVELIEETVLYPRGDFNGDGVMDRTLREQVPGPFGGAELSDLDVLLESGLWADPVYRDKDEIHGLFDSVDIHVSAENLFAKFADIEGVDVAPYDARTRKPLPHWEASRRVRLTREEPIQVMTVPVGETCFIKSDPIALPDGARLVAQSPGEAAIGAEQAGADLVVDLVGFEMTVAGRTQNPDARELDSTRDDRDYVHALIGDGGHDAFESLGAGTDAWANERGTMVARARSGVINGNHEITAFEANVRWQRTFTKLKDVPEPQFQIENVRLALVPDRQLLEASTDLSLEIRTNGTSEADWKTVFAHRSRIAGSSSEAVAIEEDGDLGEAALLSDEDIPHYAYALYRGKVPLKDVDTGDAFELRWTVNTLATSTWAEMFALATVGDPPDYSSGIQMRYGDFGDLPIVNNVEPDDGGVRVGFDAKEDYYYVLYRDGKPVATGRFEPGPSALHDRDAPEGVDESRYRIDNQRVDRPGDLDADGIDDLYELEHPDILDPLNGDDAQLDSDRDGRSNLREYQRGTDPNRADSEAEVTDPYPGRLLDAGLRIIDVHDVSADGIADLLGYSGGNVLVAIGLPAGGFEPPLSSALPAALHSNVQRAFVDLNGGQTDIVILDQTARAVHVLLGAGAGTFTSGETYALSATPARVATGDVNGDRFADLVTANGQARSISILLGNGDGTFEAAVDLPTSNSAPVELTLADMNGDALADLVVVQQDGRVAISAGRGDGTFGPEASFAAGSLVRRVATADLDRNGSADVVALGSTGVAVLLGNGDGTLQARADYAAAGALEFELADLDSDGDLDIVAGPVSASHAVLRNDGSGSFAGQSSVPTTTQAAFIDDTNRDGQLDLLCRTGESYFIAEGTGDGRFDTILEVALPELYAADLEIADLDSDGSLDALAADQQTDSLQLFAGAAGGTFSHSATIPIAERLGQFVVANLNGDEAPDLAVITERTPSGVGANQLRVLLGDGGGGFSASMPVDLVDRPTALAAGDLDGDRLDDLVVTLPLTRTLVSFVSAGDGHVTALPALELPGEPGLLQLGDLNGDHRADLIVSISGGGLSTYLAEPDGALHAGEGPAPPAGTIEALAAMHDLTGDGNADVLTVWVGPAGQQLALRPGLGDGRFGAAEILSEETDFGIPTEPFALVDLDGDGRLDISSHTTIRLALPAGRFGAAQTYAGSSPTRIADVNGDGRPDRIGVAHNALQVLVHR